MRTSALSRLSPCILLLSFSLLLEPFSALGQIQIDASSRPSLQQVIRHARPGTVIHLSPGVHELSPRPYTENQCGNCEDEFTRVNATVGVRVSGSRIRILGSDTGETVIHTNSGYGILFENCQDCELARVTITGGERDPDPNATSAAVIVKQSQVAIRNCLIIGNIGDSTTVADVIVGIIGVAGRSGSHITLRNNRIIRNSWDGVALYREAEAVIESNVIDGVDLARGGKVGGGRGVGIGVTWDAAAIIRGNLVKRYWKGIGGFVDARILVEENVVEKVATWGMTLWDAGTGMPSGVFRGNVIYDTGACGVSIVRSHEGPGPGELTGNFLVQTGQDPRYDSGEPYCFQEPIARHAVPESFRIEGNVLYRNRVAEDRPAPGDLTKREAVRLSLPILNRMKTWSTVRESDFATDFGMVP